MAAKTFTEEEARKASFTLSEEGRGSQAVHDMVTAMRANRRTGSAHTKTRGEVRGSTKKIYRQKGTGNARHGDKRAPIFVKGGVVFGPRARDYSKKVGKSTRRIAFSKVLTERIAAGDVLLVDSFEVPSGKTKDCIAALGELSSHRSLLIVSLGFDDKTYLAARNIGNLQLMSAAEVNVEHLLRYAKVVFTADALKPIAERTTRK
jgi:large subunit ribosomal protein L4